MVVLFHVKAHRTHDVLMNILQWQMLDSLFIQYDDDVKWSLALIDGLKSHRNLRHLCVIVESVPRKTSEFRLPKREIIEGLVGSWARRDWMSMFFIWREGFQLTWITIARNSESDYPFYQLGQLCRICAGH